MVKGSDGKLHDIITCHFCKFRGHYKSDCPKLDNAQVSVETHTQQQSNQSAAPTEAVAGSVNVQYSGLLNLVNALNGMESEDLDTPHESFQFAQVSNKAMQLMQHQSKKHVIIDSGSDCSVFCDRDMLSNIRPSKIQLQAKANGGVQLTTHVADLQGFFKCGTIQNH